MIDELYAVIAPQADFVLEARNLAALTDHDHMRETSVVFVPLRLPGMCDSEKITMEFLPNLVKVDRLQLSRTDRSRSISRPQ